MPEETAKEPAAGVDVAIPCYQYGRFLRDCVTSVLTQGLRDVRVLIIDNASTDDSVEVAQQLAAEDSRVDFVVHPHNLGQQASVNEGIDWASSKYFTMLPADDLLAPGSLTRAVSVMERNPDVGFTFGRAIRLNPQGQMPPLDADCQDAAWRIMAGGDLLERFCRTGRADHRAFRRDDDETAARSRRGGGPGERIIGDRSARVPPSCPASSLLESSDAI